MLRRFLCVAVSLYISTLLVGCGTSPSQVGNGQAGGSTQQTLSFGSFNVRAAVANRPIAEKGYDVYTIGMTGQFLSAEIVRDSIDLTATRIAYTQQVQGKYQIVVANSDGTNPVFLTNTTTYHNYLPSWSPDGKKLAFISERDGNYEVYSINVDGTGLTRLTNTPSIELSPVWSPDGTKIAFTSYRDGPAHIFVMNADGSGQTRLTNTVANDEAPTWSPDGTKIAFHSARDGNLEIYMMNADGSGQTRLTNNAAPDIYPNWSPDGNRIAFISSRDGNNEVYIYYPYQGTLIRPAPASSSEYFPTWSPDSKKLLFWSDRAGSYGELFTMNYNGTGTTQITNDGLYKHYPVWGPSIARIPIIGAGGLLNDATGFIYSSYKENPRAIFACKNAEYIILSIYDPTQNSPGNNTGTPDVLVYGVEGGGTPVTFDGLAYMNLNTTKPVVLPTANVNGVLVYISSRTGLIKSVLPFSVTARSAGRPQAKRIQGTIVAKGRFLAAYDANGKNLAQGGANTITVNEATGEIVRIEQ